MTTPHLHCVVTGLSVVAGALVLVATPLRASDRSVISVAAHPQASNGLLNSPGQELGKLRESDDCGSTGSPASAIIAALTCRGDESTGCLNNGELESGPERIPVTRA